MSRNSVVQKELGPGSDAVKRDPSMKTVQSPPKGFALGRWLTICFRTVVVRVAVGWPSFEKE